MKHLNKVTHVFYQAHTNIRPYGICKACNDRFNASHHSHWDFTSPIETSTSKPLNKTCQWCRNSYRQQAWAENRILWHVYRNGAYQFSTTDRDKAFADKKIGVNMSVLKLS